MTKHKDWLLLETFITAHDCQDNISDDLHSTDC